MKLQNIPQAKQCLLLFVRLQYPKPDAMTEADLSKLQEYGAASVIKIIDKKNETQYDLQLLLDIKDFVDGIYSFSAFFDNYQFQPVIYKMRVINKPFNKVKLPKSLDIHVEEECRC